MNRYLVKGYNRQTGQKLRGVVVAASRKHAKTVASGTLYHPRVIERLSRG